MEKDEDNTMRKISVISLIFMLAQIGFASAKVWLLPDYQREQFFSHRVNGDNETPPSDGSEDEEFSCSDYEGLLDLSAINENMICSKYFHGLKTCCQDWICKPNIYPYTTELCHSEGKIPTGATCTNKDGTVNYQKCKCDTNLYPYSLSNCEHILSGSSCTDEDGIHYQECISACEKAEREAVCINDCEYGCEENYPDCDECCIECKTCPRRDCTSEGYVATKQANVLYDDEDICYLSCEDSTPYYKPIGCAANYYDPNNTGCAVNYYNPDNYWGDIYCS